MVQKENIVSVHVPFRTGQEQDRGETRAGQGQDDGTGQGWDRTWSSTTVKNMG